MSFLTAGRSRELNAAAESKSSPSGFATAGFLARIFRLSRSGHQPRFPPPWVGCGARPPWATGQPPSRVDSFISPTSAFGACVSDTGTLSGAFRTQTPIDDLGLVDREAVVIGGGQARRAADGAVDVGDHAARAAHDVVMVVADPRLVARHGAGRVDAPHQAGVSKCVEHVIDGLLGHVAELLAHD